MQSSLYISKRHRHNWVRAWPAPWGECELGCTSAIGRYDRCNGTAGGRAVRILLCPPPFVFYSAELRGVPINPTHAHWGQVGTSVKWSIPVTFPNQSQVTQSQSPTTNHLSAQAHQCSTVSTLSTVSAQMMYFPLLHPLQAQVAAWWLEHILLGHLTHQPLPRAVRGRTSGRCDQTKPR